VIEHLPQELRDRFTEMREMDLQVQSKTLLTASKPKMLIFCTFLDSADSLEKQVKLFFGRAKKLKQVDRDVEHAGIIKDYYKALEIAGNESMPSNKKSIIFFRIQNQIR
jgi:inhibitor of growth protein 3